MYIIQQTMYVILKGCISRSIDHFLSNQRLNFDKICTYRKFYDFNETKNQFLKSTVKMDTIDKTNYFLNTYSKPLRTTKGKTEFLFVGYTFCVRLKIDDVFYLKRKFFKTNVLTVKSVLTQRMNYYSL